MTASQMQQGGGFADGRRTGDRDAAAGPDRLDTVAAGRDRGQQLEVLQVAGGEHDIGAEPGQTVPILVSCALDSLD